jgi:microsomal prostaglandin-E synthase 2
VLLDAFGRSKDYKKVPIATLEEHQQQKLAWNGSDVIVKELLERNYQDFRQTHNHKLTLQEFAHSESAEKWTQFATEELAALLYPNMCSSYKDSYAAFGYVDGVETFSPLQKIAIKSVGSFAMYMAASRVKSTFCFQAA